MIYVKFPLTYLPGGYGIYYPGNIADYGGSFVQGAEVFAQYVPDTPLGEHTVISALPKQPGEYPTYTYREFIDWLTDAETDQMMTVANATPQGASILEQLRATGWDFNKQKHRNRADRMVTAGILTQARRDELVGE